VSRRSRRGGAGSTPAGSPAVDGVLTPEAQRAAMLVGISAIGALVVASPVVMSAIEGRASLLSASIRFAIAFAILRVGLGLIVALFMSYREPLDAQRAEADAAAAAALQADEAAFAAQAQVAAADRDAAPAG
jgi:predicted histidine transporter YuiF (NhaC family)